MRIEDALTGTVHDYTRRQGVAFSALCLPGEQTADRAEFWNRVEAHHKRGDAIVTSTFNLTHRSNFKLTRLP
ncbi:MobA/MobL family protein [Xanthomonas phaseoli]